MQRLREPSMAINNYIHSKSNRVKRYHMTYTWNLDSPEGSWNADQYGARFIAAHIATQALAAKVEDKFYGKLKDLVINCHGGPGKLYLGRQGISIQDVEHFRVLNGLVERVFLDACNVAEPGKGIDNGLEFCSRLAKTIGCLLFAPMHLQAGVAADMPKHFIEGFEGIVHIFDGSGRIIGSRGFLPVRINKNGAPVGNDDYDFDPWNYE